MKIGKALKVIDEGWVQKDKGYRVRYQRQTDGGIETEYTPGLDDTPLDSDVSAWRTAWKMVQATQSENANFGEGHMINVTVVNDQGDQIRYYKTNEQKVYNEV